MSNETRRALRALKDSIHRNSPLIRRKLSRSGMKPDRALVYSTAKYYETLKRLAKE